MQGIKQAVKELIALMNRFRIEYAIMGGWAVRAYAIPRPTFDIDFLVELKTDELSRLHEAVESLGLHVPDAQRTGWIDRVQGFPVAKFAWPFGGEFLDINMFLPDNDFQQLVFNRRQWIKAEDFEAWFISPEDLLILKLVAHRLKDRSDVQDILLIQGSMDVGYLEKWAQWLGIEDRLFKARRLANDDESSGDRRGDE